ncbi:VanZ family protein [Paucidesulfovibrio longus]|uniref:hypothetical protein n=1 Tax=Paucidesulfovibrio longus TaxID=889 RepID=UPI0003B302FD|nr:hypothetical protein [Paucidesulfovibrio longus]
MTFTRLAGRRLLFWRVLWCAYVAWVLAMALGPMTVGLDLPLGDKMLHFGAFLVMLVAFPFRISWPTLWIPTALTVSLSGFIEIAQDLSPAWGRHPEFLDFFAGVLGGLLGLGLRLLALKKTTNAR